MSKTNQDNFQERFQAGEDVLQFFELATVLTFDRRAEVSAILNLSALAREEGINIRTQLARFRRKIPLSGADRYSVH